MTANTTINLRISAGEKALIDQAARALGVNRTAFILEHSLRGAKEIILDRTHFSLSPEAWNAFNVALDTPPSKEQAEGLARLFAAPNPW